MVRRAAILLCLVLALAASQARAACFDSDDAFMAWLEAYGPAPDTGKLACAIQYLAGSNLFRDKAVRRPLAYFFSAALFRATPATRERVIAELSASPNQTAQVIFLNAIWYGDNSESRALLQRLSTTWTSPDLAGLMAGQINTPPRALLANQAPQYEDELQQAALDLDCLWMRYLGGNDTVFVDRIVQTGLFSVHADNDGSALLGFAARWSLRNNLRIPRVRAMLEDRLQKAQGDEWTLLDNVLHGKKGEDTPPAKK